MPKGSLQDPYALTRDVSNTGHWGNGDYELHLSDADQLDHVFDLIKQSYLKKLQ